MKMSFLFPPCQNIAHIPQEGYCSSSMEKWTAEEPVNQNFISRFPWLLCSLIILLAKSWKSTNCQEAYKSAGWKMDKFKPAHFLLIYVENNILPAIFQRQNTPSDISRLFSLRCSMTEVHYALCTVHCSNSCPQYQINNLFVGIFVASSVVASKCFTKTDKFLLSSLPLMWRLFNSMLQTEKWGMDTLSCVGLDF